MASSVLFLSINQVYYQFTGVNYLPWGMALGLSLILALLYLGLILFFEKPNALHASITRFSQVYGLVLLIAVYTYSIQYTPFSPIDDILAYWDLMLGANTQHAIQFTANHPRLFAVFDKAYALLNTELTIALCSLVIFPSKKWQKEFFFLLLFTAFIGFSIYYFLPTIAPAGVFDSPYFLAEQRQTAIKFFNIHHHISHTTITGGLIAMPSFHCIWALLCQWYFSRWPIIAILAMPLNILILCACFMLGWHYFVDILASILIVFLSITVKNWLSRK